MSGKTVHPTPFERCGGGLGASVIAGSSVSVKIRTVVLVADAAFSRLRVLAHSLQWGQGRRVAGRTYPGQGLGQGHAALPAIHLTDGRAGMIESVEVRNVRLNGPGAGGQPSWPTSWAHSLGPLAVPTRCANKLCPCPTRRLDDPLSMGRRAFLAGRHGTSSFRQHRGIGPRRPFQVCRHFKQPARSGRQIRQADQAGRSGRQISEVCADTTTVTASTPSQEGPRWSWAAKPIQAAFSS